MHFHFYTFVRFCITKGVEVGNDGNDNYMSVEEFNDFIINEYYEDMTAAGIYDENDLNRYYIADFNHEVYVPRTDETIDN